MAWDLNRAFAANPLPPSQNGHVLVLSKAADLVLPSGAASVVIGNPDIADVLVQNGTSLTISGKRIGQTNMLVRDQEHRLILDLHLDVVSPDDQSITLYRGAVKAEYDCSPLCRTDTASEIDRKTATSSNPASASP